jgi:hypothetical protein
MKSQNKASDIPFLLIYFVSYYFQTRICKWIIMEQNFRRLKNTENYKMDVLLLEYFWTHLDLMKPCSEDK